MARTAEEMGKMLLNLYSREHVITAIDALEVVKERDYLRTKYGFKNGKQLTTEETAKRFKMGRRQAEYLEGKAIDNLSKHYFPLVCLDALLQNREGLQKTSNKFEKQIIRPTYGDSDLANRLVDDCERMIRRPEERMTVPEYKLKGMASLLYRMFNNSVVRFDLEQMPKAHAISLVCGNMNPDLKNRFARSLLKSRLRDELEPITQVSFHTRVRYFSSLVKNHIGNARAYRHLMTGFRVEFKKYLAYDVALRFLGVPARMLNTLRSEGITTLRELYRKTEEEFLSYEGFGEKSLKIVQKLFDDHDVWFRESKPKASPSDTEAGSNISIENRGFNGRALRILREQGIENLGHLTRYSELDLLCIADCGSVTIMNIKKVLRKNGLRLKED
jgi:hypothetical protein